MKSSDSTIATDDASESSMDDNTSDNHLLSLKSTSQTTTALHTACPREGDEIDGEPNFQDGGDPAVWETFTQNFRQVQSVLDRNRALIQQVNENHQSKIHENLVKNVALIQEINGNVSNIVSLYSNLSANFSSVVNKPRAAKSNSEEKQ